MERFEPSKESVDTLTISGDAYIPEEIIESFEGTREELKDFLFDSYMKQQLLTDFFESLGGYLDEDQIDEVRAVLAEYSDEAVYAVVSLPFELRERKFEEFMSKAEAGQSVTELFKAFTEISAKHGFGVGYHTSPRDIRPDDQDQWVIKGTEADHRDNDLMMAYYSTQYRHLFKKRDPKFVYIIRTEPSTHKTDGNWSRASSLSVVGRVSYDDVVSYVEDTAKEKAAVDINAAAA